MPLVHEPTLFFSAYVHRHPPGFHTDDPRRIILNAADRFITSQGLQTEGHPWAYASAADIDLVALDRLPPTYRPLVNAGRDLQDAETGVSSRYQCLVYAHSDVLVLQIMIARLQGWVGALQDGWSELVTELRAACDGQALVAAATRTIGCSVVCWGVPHGNAKPHEFIDDAAAMLGSGARATETDIGLLWQAELRSFDQAPSVSQDVWLLVTDQSDEADDLANARFNLPSADQPPPFAKVAIARHKTVFERAQYITQHDRLEAARHRLERRTQWVIDTQAYHRDRLADLTSPDSEEFQAKLSHAEGDLAEFSGTVTRIEELSRTLAVNRTNFLVNCTALVSETLARRVANAAQQDAAALTLLEEWSRDHEEELFRSEVGRIQGLCDQVATDIDFMRRLLDRHSAALRSGRDRLQIAAQRQIGEISASNVVDSALVVASLAAVIVLELLKLDNTLTEQTALSVNIMLMGIVGAFTLAILLSGRRSSSVAVQRTAFALTVGFAAGALASLLRGSFSARFAALNVAAFLLGSLAGLGLHVAVEVYGLRRRQHRSDRAAATTNRMRQLFHAPADLPELLEDLPPTSSFPLEDARYFAGALGRVTRRHSSAAGAGASAGPVVDRGAYGDSYAKLEIGDAVGVRYVVHPTGIAGTVDRVLSLVHREYPDALVAYENTTTVLGMRPGPNGEPEVDNTYRGRYRGFRVTYKAVHIYVYQSEPGGYEEVKLLAEIQIRTPLQNLLASTFQDVMCREGPAARSPRLIRTLDSYSPWVNRLMARILTVASDIELWLFRDVMRWRAASADTDSDSYAR